jgi:hypothetical protein
METIFSHIIQKRFSRVNEDVATDALAFILQSSDQARTGFLKLLRGVHPDLPDLRFRTQQSEGSIRPDMQGLDGPHARVFVENKFWAGLTENQPVSYLRQLSECAQPTILLVVVPAAREQTIWRQLSKRMQADGISQSDRTTPSGMAFCATTQLGPTLALTSWRTVLAALELEAASDARAMADVAQLRALCDAADSHAFIPVAAEDLTDQRTPAFILQMNTIVQDAVQLAVTNGVLDINGLRPQASWDRAGRYVKFANASGSGAWIGVHLGLWKQHGGTPLWLVFAHSDFGRGMEARRVLEPWASSKGAVACSDRDQFALGLEVVAKEEKDGVVRELAADLGSIAKALSALPPRSTPAGEPPDA